MPKNNVIEKKRKPYKYTSSYYRKLKQKIVENSACNFQCEEQPNIALLDLGTNSQTLESNVEHTRDTDETDDNIAIINSLESIQNEENTSELDDLLSDDEFDFLEVDKSASFLDELKRWALEQNITHTAINMILAILRKYVYNWLPKDSRTLLKTPRKLEIVKTESGKYWYNGLEKSLNNVLSDLNCDIEIEILINIDGLPVHKSSKTECWPILAAINDMPNIQPMVVALFCGNSKPNNIEFLTPFVNEIIKIQTDGININGFRVKTKLRLFVCDTPARALLKGIYFRYCYSRFSRTCDLDIKCFLFCF